MWKAYTTCRRKFAVALPPCKNNDVGLLDPKLGIKARTGRLGRRVSRTRVARFYSRSYHVVVITEQTSCATTLEHRPSRDKSNDAGA
ncbi:hypothetical protein Plhal703r1_c58g0163721 [Plasmopara halstedii]